MIQIFSLTTFEELNTVVNAHKRKIKEYEFSVLTNLRTGENRGDNER